MRVTVVGDALLDVDIEGSAERLAPDAPVPVVDAERRVQRAGGAGLAASLLARDGHEVELVTALGADEAAGRLRACLAGIRVVPGRLASGTAVKTRIRANGRTIARVDDGGRRDALPEFAAPAFEAIAAADAILVADYGGGVTAHPGIREALERRGTAVPLVWDPHPRGATPVAMTAVATPNLVEATRAAGVEGAGIPAGARAASRLRDAWRCGAIVVTLGDLGALLLDTGAALPLVVGTKPVRSADPCGAGDRFAATLTVALASGEAPASAVRAAVEAAGRFLASGGVSAPEPATTPLEPPGTPSVIAKVRRQGGTIVATGGCFDLLHAGHVRTLEAARALGDCLVVCLNSDESVRRLKGPERPIVGERERAEVLRSLSCVDDVVVFDEDTPEAVLERIRPDIWVKGGDYSAARLPEARTIERWGGQVVTVPYHLGHSTTALAAALAAVG